MAKVMTDARDMARTKWKAARETLTTAQQAYGRAAHVVRWGSNDPREEANAHRDIFALRADALDAQAAHDEAEREWLRVCEVEAGNRAPAYRARVEELVADLDARLAEVVELTARLEAVGQQAAADCRDGMGRWAGGARAPYDRELAAIGDMVRSLLPGWRHRLRNAGWLQD